MKNKIKLSIVILMLIIFTLNIQANVLLDPRWKIINGFLDIPDYNDQTIIYKIPIYKNARLHSVICFDSWEIIYYIPSGGIKVFNSIQQFYIGQKVFGIEMGEFVPTSCEFGIGGFLRNEVYKAAISKGCEASNQNSTNKAIVRVFLSEFDSVFVKITNSCYEYEKDDK